MRANLDGRVGMGIFEAKHIGAFSKAEDARERYYAQCQHNMAVTGTPLCYLSIFVGTQKWEMFEIPADADYQAELISRETEFWGLVESRVRPRDIGEAETTVMAVDAMREVDMTDNNAWTAYAADWLDNKAAEKKYKKADKELKELVEDDVRRAHGRGVEINRAKNGALRVKESK